MLASGCGRYLVSLNQILIRVELAGTNEEAALDWLQSVVKRAFLFKVEKE